MRFILELIFQKLLSIKTKINKFEFTIKFAGSFLAVLCFLLHNLLCIL
nr:hypothetical protein BAR15_110093 [Bartonella sp. AR 15-3]